MMFNNWLLIAVFSEEPTMNEVLQFILVGLLVVLAALASLALMSTAVAWILKTIRESKTQPKPAPIPDEGLPEETLAVIVAAVAAVVTQPHRIVHIRGLTPEDMAWALQGRSQIHASHALKPQDHR
ncbi:OadG family transporter subunit [Aeoliella sp. ICT_H6.2]|uniref:OadG family transporter subunit n=1 Tax=Aeoliella straminimaris TaxID=2954799 RepID=A0A9X2FFM9_9BACT|nr:OadG family transporter subunit [Aeoliella straminimaris]MCO6043246.1 OadG family transporter subunit [Aeoliella straminimaris]